jgi:outer membrane protein
MVRQQNTLRTLVLKLKEVMFFPIEDALEIDTTIPEILIITEFENDISLDFESTKTNLPAVNALNLQLMGAKVDYAANKGSLFPSISFNTGLNTGYSSTRLDNNGQKVSFEDQFKNNVGKYLGLSLSIPLFNNNILGTKVRISKQNYHIAQITYNEEIRKLQNVIQQALLDMEGAAEEFMQAQQREKSSDLANTINQRKYEQGLLSVIELHTSENRLLEAKAEKVRAQVTYMIKKRLVDYYNSGVIKIEN